MGTWRKRLEKWAGELRYRASLRGYTCDGCGKEVFDYPAVRLCPDCARQALQKERVCPKCGRRTVSDGICQDCKGLPPKFARGFSPFAYEGLIAGMLNRFKNGERHLAFFFAEAMFALLSAQSEKGEVPVSCASLCVCSVPGSAERRRARGYDQAAELAKAFCRLSGAEYFPDALALVREPLPQKSLSAAERRKNTEGVYRASGRQAGGTVLLIDDLMTTGATADACTAALLKSGAERVYVLTAAAVPERPSPVYGAE